MELLSSQWENFTFREKIIYSCLKRSSILWPFIWEFISQIAHAGSEHLEFSMGKNTFCVCSGLGPAFQTTSCSCCPLGNRDKKQRSQTEIGTVFWKQQGDKKAKTAATILITKEGDLHAKNALWPTQSSMIPRKWTKMVDGPPQT